MNDEDLQLGLDVQRVLNRAVRPLLNIDAGDIEILDVADGHVELAFLGSCSRCVFRANCANYTVVERLRTRFADRGATFSVRGVPTPVPSLATSGPEPR